MTIQGRQGRTEQDLPLIADSGEINGDLHVVQVRLPTGGTIDALVKGDPPVQLRWRAAIYRRSTFTHRDESGSLRFTYVPAT